VAALARAVAEAYFATVVSTLVVINPLKSSAASIVALFGTVEEVKTVATAAFPAVYASPIAPPLIN
jgi:hypothetical protein